MTFPSGHISEPRASVLPFVRVHDLLLRLRSLLRLFRGSFGSVYNYSGVQRGQSVSMFLPFLVSFRRFICNLAVFAFSCVRVFITSDYCSALSFRVA